MASDHSDSERGNLLPPHELLFPISSKGSFICTIPQPLLHQIKNTKRSYLFVIVGVRPGHHAHSVVSNEGQVAAALGHAAEGPVEASRGVTGGAALLTPSTAQLTHRRRVVTWRNTAYGQMY